jgi:adenosylcobinamide-phosphate synthase
VGLGNVINILERLFWYKDASKLTGVLAVLLLILPLLLLAFFVQLLIAQQSLLAVLVSSVVVYFCIAARSLSEHGLAVSDALEAQDVVQARTALAMIVSRDTGELQESQVASACCESILENGSDGIFAAIFWFCVFGLPGVVIYRASNTLDAMWGYKSQRYLQFGWAAARLDDVLNFIPARLVALSYSLCGNFSQGIRCWVKQGRYWKSPNAGPVMAAGAGSLNIQLGGAAVYAGEASSRPVLGCGDVCDVKDIKRCLRLVKLSLVLWLICIAIVA